MADAIEFDFIGKDDVSNILTVIADNTQGLTDVMDELAKAGAAVTDVFSSVASTGRAFADALLPLRSALADVSAFSVDMADGLRTDVGAFDEVTTATRALGDAAFAVTDALTGELGVVSTSTDTLAALADVSLRVADAADIKAEAITTEADALAQDSLAARASTLAHDALAVSADKATTGARGFAGALAAGITSLANNALGLSLNAYLVDSFGLHTISTGIEYQKWMAIISSLTGSAGMSIQQMTDTLLASAPVWRQTPADLAQALYYVRSAGFVAKDGMDILKASSEAAAGGLGSVVDIAKAVTTMLVDYGIKGSQAASVTEVFLNGVVAGKTNVEEFAAALGKVMPTASAMGVSMDGVIVALAAMTHTGLSAAQSATYLRSIITRLDGQFSAVQKAAAGYGITLDQVKWAHMAQEGPMALIDQLHYLWQQAHDSAAKYSNDPKVIEQRTTDAFSKMVGGIRSGTGAYALIANAAKNYSFALGIVDGQHGTLAQHFQQMSQTIGGAWLGVKASLATLASQFVVTFGPQIAGLLNAVAGAAARLSNALQSHPQVMRAIGVALLGIAAVINGAALGALGGLVLEFAHITPLLERGTGALGPVAGLFGKLAQAGTHAGSAFGGGLAGIIEKIVMGVTHMGTVLDIVAGKLQFLARFNPGLILAGFDKLRGVFDGVAVVGMRVFNLFATGEGRMALLRGALSGLWGIVSGGLPALGALVGSLSAVILPVLLIAGAVTIAVLAFTKFRTQTMAALGPLLAEVHNVFGSIGRMIGGAIKEIQATWAQMWPQVKPAMEQLLAAVKQMGPVWQVLGTVVKIVAAIIIGALAGLVQGFLRALPFIIGVFTSIIKIVTNVAAIIVAIFHGQWGKIPGLVGNIFGAIVHLIVSALGAVGSFIAGAVLGILQWFNKLTGGALSGVVGFFSGIVHWFQHLADTLVGHSIVPDMINGIVRFIASLPARALGLVLGFALQFIGHFHLLQAAVVAIMDALPARIMAALSGLGGMLANVGTNAMNALRDAIINAATNIAQAAANVMHNIINAAKNALGIHSPSTVFLEIGQHTMLGMAGGITTGGKHATSAMDAATSDVIHAARKNLSQAHRQALSGQMGAGVTGAGIAGAPGGSAGGMRDQHIHVHITGGMGAGLSLLNPSDRRRFAQQIAKELSLATNLQGIAPIGYSGRGVI